MQKTENQPAQKGGVIANRTTYGQANKDRGSVKLLLILADRQEARTIEDTSKIELDQMLSEFGY